MRSLALVLVFSVATGAFAQAPAIGPGGAQPPASRGDLWQMLTPEQRHQLWRSLTPEQRANVWRGLQPQERREMRERLDDAELRGGANSWPARRRLGDGEDPNGKMMTPEERQQMREQIREAHRLRRERMEAKRAPRSQ